MDDKVKCPIEPGKPYAESVCARIEPHVKGVEEVLANQTPTESSGGWLEAVGVMALVTAPIWITAIISLGTWCLRSEATPNL